MRESIRKSELGGKFFDEYFYKTCIEKQNKTIKMNKNISFKKLIIYLNLHNVIIVIMII